MMAEGRNFLGVATYLTFFFPGWRLPSPRWV